MRAFVDWHLAATGRAAKSKDWSAKFRTWVRRDVTDDKLEVRARTMSETKLIEPTETAVTDLPADERKALADAARTALDLPKTGTEGGRA